MPSPPSAPVAPSPCESPSRPTAPAVALSSLRPAEKPAAPSDSLAAEHLRPVLSPPDAPTATTPAAAHPVRLRFSADLAGTLRELYIERTGGIHAFRSTEAGFSQPLCSPGRYMPLDASSSDLPAMNRGSHCVWSAPPPPCCRTHGCPVSVCRKTDACRSSL